MAGLGAVEVVQRASRKMKILTGARPALKGFYVPVSARLPKTGGISWEICVIGMVKRRNAERHETRNRFGDDSFT